MPAGKKAYIYGLDVDAVEQEKTRKRLEALGYGPELHRQETELCEY